jgi:ClpX C4-type zinc finger
MASLRKKPMACSFCGRGSQEVSRLLAGPSVYICDTCVGHCNRMLDAAPSDFQGWDKVSGPDLLKLLPVTEAAIEGSRSMLEEQIAELRKREVSWQEIGGALGITRQAAWERFS